MVPIYLILSQCFNGNISGVKMFRLNIRINCVATICKTNAQGCKKATPVDVCRSKMALLELPSVEHQVTRIFFCREIA